VQRFLGQDCRKKNEDKKLRKIFKEAKKDHRIL
jgi:hypothetical protein